MGLENGEQVLEVSKIMHGEVRLENEGGFYPSFIIQETRAENKWWEFRADKKKGFFTQYVANYDIHCHWIC